MTAQDLLANFDLIAEAPNGIARLRELILQLAVQGRLVPQDPDDEPAVVLLANVRTERHDAVEGRRSRKGQSTSPLCPGEVRHGLPQGWSWTAFSEIADVSGGVTKGRRLRGETAGYPYLRVANVQRGYLDLAEVKEIEIGTSELARYALNPGDLLITEGGDWDKVGRMALWQGEISPCLHQNHVFRARLRSDGILHGWVMMYFNSAARDYFAQASKQTTNLASINMRQLRSCPVPLPPLAEQKRIVAKVDELMKRCDALEARQNERNERRTVLVAACLHALTAGPRHQVDEVPGVGCQARDSGSEARNLPATATRRATGKPGTPAAPAPPFILHPSSFTLLFDTPDAVRELRGTILQLAVQGRLVPQDPNDEPAVVLLGRIAERMAARSLKRKAKPQKGKMAGEPTEARSHLPTGWTWTQLAELAAVLNGRAYAKAELLDQGTPVLRVGNLFTSEHWYYSDLELEDDKYCDAGDLLFAWSASFGPVIWAGPKVIYHYHIWKLSLHSEEDLDRNYLYRFLQHKTQEIRSAGHGVSMLHMTKEKMEKVLVPIPPLSEQKRIVAKVNELMALCDALEARLSEERDAADTVAAAVVHSLCNPGTGNRKEAHA